MTEQAAALSRIPVRDWTNILIDEITKKYANRGGGGHYRRLWSDKSWCCDHCQTIYDALIEYEQKRAGGSDDF